MNGQPNAIAATENFEFDALGEARNYRAALLREFQDYLGAEVVEIGAGVGQFTKEIATLPTVHKILAVEPERKFCQQFLPEIRGATLTHGTIEDLPAGVVPNSIVCVNVLEHIGADSAELKKFHACLRPKQGYLCLFVPARPEIYAPIDQDFGHFRRYTKPELERKLQVANFSIVSLHYFNWVGYFAWWLNFCVLRQRKFKPNSVRIFDQVIFPWVYRMEKKLVRPPFGQSLIAVAKAS